MSITAAQLKSIMPGAKRIKVFQEHFDLLMPLYEINNKFRQAAFLAQVAHESGELNYVREIASGKAYERREDLGNIHPGDGVKFKGRGLIQVTGRYNYRDCSRALFQDERLLKTPEILEQPQYAVESACWFWKLKGLNQIADKQDTWRTKVKIAGKHMDVNPFQYITYRINGALRGYASRLKYYKKALSVL